MRPPLSRLLALALLLAAPVHAAFVDPVSLAPTLGLAQNVPAFRASVLTQVQIAGSLSGQLTPSLAPLISAAASAPTPADPWKAESAKLVGALVAQPAAVAAYQTELRAAIGDQGVDQLQKAAARLQAKAAATPELGAQLQDLRSGLNLEDPASVDQLGTRLNALFENSKTHGDASSPAGTVAADEDHHKKPLVSLVKHGETPVMSPAELETYLAGSYTNNDGDTVGRTVVTARGMKKAIFASGDYHPQYDAELKRMGVDQVIIKTPTRAELGRYSEEEGYHLKSEYERWVMTTRTLEEHKAALGKAQRVRQFENQLADSDKIQTKLVPLTVEDFEKWYPVYEDEVVGKPGGKRNIAHDYARKLAEKGKLEGWYGLWYYDPADPTKIVGGVISKAWPERGMFVMGYAAYRPELKDINPSVRTFKETMALAKSLGYKVLSFGQDTNFFGYDYSLGLMSNKAGFLLTPYPEDEIVLMKMLDASKIATVKNKANQTGGYMFFGIKRDAPVVERYLKSKDEGKPKEAQELLGSAHYFDGTIDPAKETTVVWHYKGDDPNPLRVPVGVDVNDRKMPASGN